MTTSVVLFTRDLRVHDNPTLHAAAAAEQVVPLFVLDEAILRSSYNSPNRASFLAGSLLDLDRSVQRLGSEGLVVRRGDVAEQVAEVADSVGAEEVHVSADWSRYAQRRQQRLTERLERDGRRLVTHDATVSVHRPGAVTPSGKDHFAVFTPYYRAWDQEGTRAAVEPPKLRSPRVRRGSLPTGEDLCPGERAPYLPEPGESAGRDRLTSWLDSSVHEYDERNDDLAGDDTSRISPYLHFGCLSPLEVTRRAGRSQGAGAFVRQVAWRDFNLQVLAARPDVSSRDYRHRGDRWREGGTDLEAWKQGRTGIPVVDAAMRQLLREGWMHNRGRLIVGSFLTKHLYVDWREGAQHFLDHLVDGDIANNQLNWQWVAGTGTDTRPNRVLNPLRQAERFDPEGAYVRRYVPELAEVAGAAVHEPWKLPEEERKQLDYPEPLVDLDEARRRFLAERG